MRAVAAATGLNVATPVPLLPVEARPLPGTRSRTGSPREGAFAPPVPRGPRGHGRAPPRRAARRLLRRTWPREADLWRVAARRSDPRRRRRAPAAARHERAVRGRARRLDPHAAARRARAARPEVVRAIRHALYGVMVEHLPQPEGRRAALAARAAELASRVLPRIRTVTPKDPSNDRPRIRLRARRARPHAVRARRRARRLRLAARRTTPCTGTSTTTSGSSPSTTTSRTSNVSPSCSAAGRASGRRAAAPATCRSSRSTIPSTRANAGS